MSNSDRILLLGSTVTNVAAATNYMTGGVDMCNNFASIYNPTNIVLSYSTNFLSNSLDIAARFMLNPSNVSADIPDYYRVGTSGPYSQNFYDCTKYTTTVGSYTYHFFINTSTSYNSTNGTAHISFSCGNLQPNYAVINILLVGGGAGGTGSPSDGGSQTGGGGGGISLYTNYLINTGAYIGVQVGYGGNQNQTGGNSGFGTIVANGGAAPSSSGLATVNTSGSYYDGYTNTGYYYGGQGGRGVPAANGTSSDIINSYFTTSPAGTNINSAMSAIYNNNTSALNGYNIKNNAFSVNTLSGGGGADGGNAGNGTGGVKSTYSYGNNGESAYNCGGGGGGAGGTNGGGHPGGNGANGLVVIWYKSGS